MVTVLWAFYNYPQMHSCEPHVHKFQAYLLHMQVSYSQPTGKAFADKGGIFEYLLEAHISIN